MFVSEVMLSGNTLQPHVDQFMTITMTLAKSSMIIQCRHYQWELKNLLQRK
jgi:hypothetical protein